MKDAIIVGAARTPIGNLLGQFKTMTAPQLGSTAIEAALNRAGLSGDRVDEVIMGNVLSAGVGQAPARQAALGAGIPSSVSALTINKVCGSGLKSVMLAAQAIRLNDASVVLAGGMESMTRAPFLSPNMRSGQKLGDVQLVDAMVFDGLTCAFEHCHMGNHAEHIANRFSISREAQDRFAVQSQQRAGQAIESGAFAAEIAPVTIKSRKGEIVVDKDEGPRSDTDLESLGKLRTVFDASGTVTAGNASTISDGAAAVAVVGDDIANELDVPWKAKIIGYQTSGGDPKELFYAPVLAIQDLFAKTGLSKDDIDCFEINEAFAAQMLACVQELGLDESRVNPLGGGISLGHPIGASGARTLVTLLHTLHRQQMRMGVVSLCLGGGNAVAMAVEMSTA